jgi:hypothetical protein
VGIGVWKVFVGEEFDSSNQTFTLENYMAFHNQPVLVM